jgi:hypothetical protein
MSPFHGNRVQLWHTFLFVVETFVGEWHGRRVVVLMLFQRR